MRSLPICVYIRGGCKMIFCPPPLGKHSFLLSPLKDACGLKRRRGEESRKRPFPLSSFDKKRVRFCSALPYCSVLYSVYTPWIQHCWKTKETNCICVSYGTAYVTSGQKKSGNLWTQLKNLYFWGGGITVVHVQNESLHSLLFPAAATTMSVPWSDGFERDKITRTALISAEKTIFMVNPFPGGIPGSSPFWPFAGKWPLIRRARHIWDFECVYMCIERGGYYRAALLMLRN